MALGDYILGGAPIPAAKSNVATNGFDHTLGGSPFPWMRDGSAASAQNFAPDVATGSGQAYAPGITGDGAATFAPSAATGSGQAYTPTITATGGASFAPTAASGTGAAYAPVISGDVAVFSPATASGSGQSYTATISAGVATFNVTAATGSCQAYDPAISVSGAQQLSPSTATGTGAAYSSGISFGQAYQYARPNADVSSGAWTNELGSSANLYASIDEEIADDADYIQSDGDPAGSACELSLAGVVTSDVTTGHYMRIRISRDGPGPINLTVNLKSNATLVATRTFTGVSSTPTTEVIALTGIEAAAIQNPPLLTVEFVGDV